VKISRMGVAVRLAVVGSLLLAQGPATASAQSLVQLRNKKCGCLAETKVITFYEGAAIPANTGISSGTYTLVDGYRFINIFVEFEQETATEAPVSLGVIFAFDAAGKHGSRRYFNFEQNFSGTADPQMITLSGAGSWHGSPHNKSSYTARLPIMGPYVQVFPFNHEGKPRKFSIVAYLST
jgi:hypothetical protein